ncbi:MAG TPA: ArgE/DapE family deacylase [Bacillus sp. (in: firmicutes)]|nr:ArgE/DapE family deacylase [Bacillus sp. (in: firmicutes)]
MKQEVDSQALEQVMNQIEELWKEEIAFLQQLGKYPSTLGNEAAIQRYIAEYLEKEIGLEVDILIPDVKKISTHPGFSPVEWSYEGRPVVIGKEKVKGQKIGKSLILQGHIDVVSPEPMSLWNYQPWGSTIVGDRMYGRGIADMKAGVAAMIFALKAVKKAGIELGADVLVQTVIEEECTGNGALTPLVEGFTADGALIPEPLPFAMTAQVGVIWMRIKVKGAGAHAERASQAVNAIEKAYVMVNALLDYQKEINRQPRSKDFSNHVNPFNVNIGKIHAGDWPSSVPSECIVEARIGFDVGQTPQQIKEDVKAFLLDAASQDEWLKKAEPEITFYGFHAEGMSLNKEIELFKYLERAHKETTGEEISYAAFTGTTDARFYNLYYDIPATCYGPEGGNLHGPDEWVNLPSVKQVTKTYAAFLLDWCGIRNS